MVQPASWKTPEVVRRVTGLIAVAPGMKRPGNVEIAGIMLQEFQIFLTTNQVAGLVDRIKRPWRNQVDKRKNHHRPGEPSYYKPKSAELVPNPAATAAHDRREAVPAVVRKPVVRHPMLVDFRSSVPARPSKIRKLEGRVMSCQWPIGEPGNTGFRFCGDPSQPGRPYCEDHCKIAYVVVREKREDAA
jgi:hypothetical protein